MELLINTPGGYPRLTSEEKELLSLVLGWGYDDGTRASRDIGNMRYQKLAAAILAAGRIASRPPKTQSESRLGRTSVSSSLVAFRGACESRRSSGSVGGGMAFLTRTPSNQIVPINSTSLDLFLRRSKSLNYEPRDDDEDDEVDFDAILGRCRTPSITLKVPKEGEMIRAMPRPR